MKNLSDKITDFYIKKGFVPEDKKEIYSYGFRLIIADIINFSIVITLGIVLKKLCESILFLITLCTVRRFSGGFHAKTYWLCRLSMIITFTGVLTLSEIIIKTNNKLNISLLINVLCMIIIFRFSPVKHPNKTLTTEQIHKNKFKAIITSFILSVLSILITATGFDKGVTISSTLLAIVILMIISLVMQKEGHENV